MARKRGRKPKPAGERKRSTTIFLHRTQRARLQKVARARDVSMGQAIREAIELWLAKYAAEEAKR